MTVGSRKGRMRDARFVAHHRGGPLQQAHQRLLIAWACDCSRHVFPLLRTPLDDRLLAALEVANAWAHGKATVGDARNASLAALGAARQAIDPTAIAVARSVAQAVATAHMADHCISAAWYALKAVKARGGSIEEERTWQDRQLFPEIKQLVLSARTKRSI